jgi:acetate---CoA ligase (ADP-forming)
VVDFAVGVATDDGFSLDVSRLLAPESIAILGASEDSRSFGGRALRSLLENGYPGALFAVNPNRVSAFGLRCYRDIQDVPRPLDLAILALPKEVLIPNLVACANSGVKLAVVITSGFAEAGSEGAALQNEIQSVARGSQMRILGPNCLGFYNVGGRIAAAATGALLEGGQTALGRVSLVSQSGAMAFVSVLSRAREHGLGFRYVIAAGNECDLDVAELIAGLADDDGTSVIALLLEGIRDPTAFRRAAQRARRRGKRIVVLKTGRSHAGGAAALAHTAALAGSDAVHRAVFAADGIIQVSDVDELWHVAQLLAREPPLEGRRVLVATTSGGLGGLLADHLVAQGLMMARPTADTVARLRAILPDFASLDNPLDLTGVVGGGASEADTWTSTLQTLDDDQGSDIVVLGLIVARSNYEEVSEAIGKAIQRMRKPLVFVSAGGRVADGALVQLAAAGIPIFTSPSCCARSIAAASGLDTVLDLQQATPSPAADSPFQFTTPGARALPHAEVQELLDAYELPAAKGFLCSSAEEARARANEIGFPVVLKGVSARIVHKSDARAVVVGIRSSTELIAAIADMHHRLGNTDLLVQEMVQDGIECIVGAHHDPQFGPVVVVGAGGVLTELIGDRQLLLPPVSVEDAFDAIRRLKVFRLLQGYRSAPASDIPALARVISGVSRLVRENRPPILAVDLNPVIVLPAGEGVRVADARIFVSSESAVGKHPEVVT